MLIDRVSATDVRAGVVFAHADPAVAGGRSIPTSFTNLLSFCQLPRLQEHRVEHALGEDTGEGVLLGGMVAT
jgi:hypothetical protein